MLIYRIKRRIPQTVCSVVRSVHTVCVPPLGDSVNDAAIMKWHVPIGAFVKQDTPIVTLATHKTTVEIPAEFSGRIVKFHGTESHGNGAEGTTIEVGKPLYDIKIMEKVSVRSPVLC